MICYSHTGTQHDAQTESQEYAAATFDYLLNTPDRRGRCYTWQQFAAMIRIHIHPGNTKARNLADMIEEVA